jgi:methyl-accepting chemotaxis protein
LAIIGLAIAVALALGFGLAWWLGRSIAQPLRDATTAATRVAQGDLSVNLGSQRQDESSDLFVALRTMVGGLSGVVDGVRSGVESIASASSQIAAGTQDLSNRTDYQARELQETTSTLQHLTESAEHNAHVSLEATSLASSAQTVATKGGQIVSDVVQRMSAISSASKRIADITAVIDGIAFQTNILALNAAVEAARGR